MTDSQPQRLPAPIPGQMDLEQEIATQEFVAALAADFVVAPLLVVGLPLPSDQVQR